MAYFKLFYLLLYQYSPGVNKLNTRLKTGNQRTFASTCRLCNMTPRRQALLLSSSNCHGYSFLEYAKEEISNILANNNINELIFIPYALKDYDGYTAKIREVLEPWGISVTGIHTCPNPIEAINTSKAVFVGGGNTFLLLKTLYDNNLVQLIRKKVEDGCLVYIGSSAGTNVATKSIHTTNDMPIIYPPTFEAIGVVPFNINPHYIDEISDTHKGETRDERIYEYLAMTHASPVLALKEGSMLHVDGYKLTLKGIAGALLFKKFGEKPVHYATGSDVSFLFGQDKEL